MNISPDDPFAFSEILRTAKQVSDRDYKKYIHQGPGGKFPSSTKIETA